MSVISVSIERQFPTWTVRVNGEQKFSGLWRRSSAEALAWTWLSHQPIDITSK